MAHRELQSLLEHLSPRRNEGVYVFCTVPDGYGVKENTLAFFRETEGVTVIMDQASARSAGLEQSAPMAWITLEVHSSLEAVGLTAAVSTALAGEGIACNVIAAYHHDHLFVPLAEAGRAMEVLEALSEV